MITSKHQITVNGEIVDVVRKNIKNLHLAVYPPTGRVRVAVPLQVNDEAVKLAIISRLGWIRRQQVKLARQQRQSPREYVSGETHYFQGRRYRLNVIYHNAPAKVTLPNKTRINLYVRDGSDTSRRHGVFQDWYRQQLKDIASPIIAKWEEQIGIEVKGWGVRQMKTKWGSCNTETHRIWINLELVKKPIQCLEYIIVHELVHLLQRRHNDEFRTLMDRFMPHWRLIREELNQEPLGHDTWEY